MTGGKNDNRGEATAFTRFTRLTASEIQDPGKGGSAYRTESRPAFAVIYEYRYMYCLATVVFIQ